MVPDLGTDFLDRLRAFVRRRLPSATDADDVLQTVLLKLAQHGATVQPGAVPAWLFQVARSAVIDWHRARRRAPAALDAEPVSAGPLADERGELARCLEPLLADLPADDRALLQAVDLDGLSQAELARRDGVAPSTVKSRVQRARARLRAIVEACCEVELDRRGQPTGAWARRGGACGCGP